MSVIYKTATQNYNPDFGYHGFGTGKEQTDIYDLCDGVINSAHDNKIIERAKEIVSVGKVHNVECSFGEMLVRPKDQTGPHADMIFTAIVDGSEGEHYHVALHFIKDEDNFFYDCECPYFSKVPNKQICKHVVALAMWIKENYVFDPDNYVLERQAGDKEAESISIYDGVVEIPVINNIEGLKKTFSEDVLNKMTIFEKECRFLEKGIRCYNEDKTAWSDKKVREYFASVNEDFELFTHKLLKKSNKIDDYYHHDDDYNYIKWTKNNEIEAAGASFNKIEDRIKYIDLSVVWNPNTITSIVDFCRLVNTFERVTKFKVGSRIFEGKYIFFPNYLEILVVEASQMPHLFFGKFNLGTKTFKDGFCIKDKDKNLLVIYNWIKGFIPSFD